MNRGHIWVFVFLLCLLSAAVKVNGHNDGYVVNVPNGTTPTIDGKTAVGEWNDASGVSFNYTTTYLKHDAGSLYVAFNVTDATPVSNQEGAVFFVDRNNDGGSSMKADDTAFGAFRNGTMFEFNGTATTPPGPGWKVALFDNNASYTVEFNVTNARIGLVSGVSKVVGLLLNSYDSSIHQNYFWPVMSRPTNPSDWGDMIFLQVAGIFQGDLALTGDSVLTIQGKFDINGSIFVEENATLILRNAMVNFTRAGSGILMQDPANGNPRLQAENTRVVGLSDNRFYGNSSATFSNFTTNAFFYFSDKTNVAVLDSTFGGIQARDFSMVTISNSTLQNLDIALLSGNASVVNLSPGFFKYWDFWVNCSVAFKSQTRAPDVALNQTTVNTWSFSFQGTSTATITKCTLSFLHANMNAFPSGKIDAYDSVIGTVELYSSTIVTLTNITYTLLDPRQNSTIDIYGHLDVHVIDDSPSPGQSVQSTNVTAAFSNGTLAEQVLTGTDGWTRLTLMEKMKNATDEYPVGPYTVNATYLSYSSGATVNMTGNKAITLTLVGFVIPEFPSFLILPLFMISTSLAVMVYIRKHGSNRVS
jgi:hypothetical protein